ncbi:MAG TPA: DHH family phosphoesterase [Clostridiales bacterium]|nr:DHH family phosphoesterase [Clostridiales bacterium]
MDSKKILSTLIPQVSIHIWIILMLTVVIAVLDWMVAIPCFILFVYLAWHNIRTNYRRKAEISEFIENLNLNIDTATKDTLLNFPMPLVISEPDGSIIWYNSSFRDISEHTEIFENAVKSVVKELRSELPVDNSDRKYMPISRQININGRHYNVLISIARRDQQDITSCILILYFIDNTELVNLKQTYADERIVAGICVIDNYEDLMQSMEDPLKPQILAEIDKRVVKWISFTNGIIKKYERDRYLFIFEQKYMKDLEEKKFEILDSVKEINIGNKLPVTLSLGFGLNGGTLAENLGFAAASIDLALGRGGDQVVLKNGENFSFFGGKSRELEKRTKVKARVIAYALRELIDQADRVLIMGHENGDIDSLGASLGLYRVVRSRSKDAYIVLNKINPTIEKLAEMIRKDEEYADLFLTGNEAIDLVTRKTLLIVVDNHRRSFAEVPELIDESEQTVVIDHHRRGADYIQDTVLTYQEPYASSTSELVTEVVQYIDEKLKLNQIEAEALYAGIVVDTKNFTFKTGVRTFEAASYLRRQGVDTVAVKRLFQNDIETYSKISAVVSGAELIEGDIAISVCGEDIDNPQLIAAKAADELLNLSGIAASFVLCSVGGEVWISGRSLGEINVQMILEKLGGGGHMSVAGAQLPGTDIKDAKERLKYAIMNYKEEMAKPNT